MGRYGLTVSRLEHKILKFFVSTTTAAKEIYNLGK